MWGIFACVREWFVSHMCDSFAHVWGSFARVWDSFAHVWDGLLDAGAACHSTQLLR